MGGVAATRHMARVGTSEEGQVKTPLRPPPGHVPLPLTGSPVGSNDVLLDGCSSMCGNSLVGGCFAVGGWSSMSGRALIGSLPSMGVNTAMALHIDVPGPPLVLSSPNISA